MTTPTLAQILADAQETAAAAAQTVTDLQAYIAAQAPPAPPPPPPAPPPPAPAPAPAAPVFTSLPGFIGSAVQGVALAVDTGVTSPPATSFTYAWLGMTSAGVSSGSGGASVFSPLAAGDVVSCVLTPFNGSTAGAPVTIPGLVVAAAPAPAPTPAPPPPAPAPAPAVWTTVAPEWITPYNGNHGTFQVQAGQTARFGDPASNSWIEKTFTVSQNETCDLATFGTVDPAPGVGKVCQIKS